MRRLQTPQLRHDQEQVEHSGSARAQEVLPLVSQPHGAPRDSLIATAGEDEGALKGAPSSSTVRTMELGDLAGRAFGPAHLHVSPDGVEDFVEATGDDPNRWTDHAPPGFISVALFAAAPELLASLYEHSVIHGEQSYTWLRPFEIGIRLGISGQVTKVRERGGVSFITFEMDVEDPDGSVARGSALFLASAGSTPTRSEEQREPGATDRGPVGLGQVSASRSDLVRYAAATRDWNPIHWDHDTAVAAGLSGVVVHGLLQASWVFKAASRRGRLSSARVRFRHPLLPARPVSVELDENRFSLTDGTTEYLTATIGYVDE